jgi:hypothetical protein
MNWLMGALPITAGANSGDISDLKSRISKTDSDIKDAETTPSQPRTLRQMYCTFEEPHFSLLKMLWSSSWLEPVLFR